MNQEELDTLASCLVEDVAIAFENLEVADTPYHRRTLVRTIFAAIEGLTYVLKQSALERAEQDPQLYTTAELAMLREETYTISAKGEVKIQSKMIPVVENFRFTLTMFLRSQGQAELDFSDDEMKEFWQAFERTKRIRNRIVHPKNANDLIISDKELAEIQDIYWGVALMPHIPGLVNIFAEMIKTFLRKLTGRKPLQLRKLTDMTTGEQDL